MLGSVRNREAPMETLTFLVNVSVEKVFTYQQFKAMMVATRPITSSVPHRAIRVLWDDLVARRSNGTPITFPIRIPEEEEMTSESLKNVVDEVIDTEIDLAWDELPDDAFVVPQSWRPTIVQSRLGEGHDRPLQSIEASQTDRQ